MQTDWPRVTNRNSREDVRRKLETVIILRKKQTEACKIERVIEGFGDGSYYYV